MNEPRTNGGDAHYQQQMHINPSPPVRGAPASMPSVFANAQQRRPPIPQYPNQYSSQQPQQMNMNNSSAAQSVSYFFCVHNFNKIDPKNKWENNQTISSVTAHKSPRGPQPANVATTTKSAPKLG